MRRVTALGIGLVLLATACTAGDTDVDARRVRGTPVPTPASGEAPEPQVQTASAGLERFDGCRSLLEHLRAEAVDRVSAYGLPGQAVGDVVTLEGSATRAEPQAAEASGDTAGAAPSGPSAPAFSGTNIQELGVDEPDIVKTDGRRIVAIAGGALHVLAVEGADLRRLGRIELEGGHGRELLLVGDRALVLGSDYGTVEPAASPEILPRGERSVVTVVDLRGPEVVSTLHLEGDYVSARLAEGIARIVLRSGAGTSLPFETPGEGTSEDDALRHNRAVVENATLTRWLPRYVVEDAESPARTGTMTDCATTYHPAGFSGLGLVTVVTLDPADPEPRESTSVLAEAEVVYASPRNLYVATTERPEGPVPLPRPVPDAPTGAVPEDAPSPPTVQETELHRFDITDPETATYVASGTVPGRVLNQWSISEHDGHLRVATTLDDLTGRDDSESRVTVLATRDGALVEVGSVGGLGHTERIYAVRFMGEVGYVVTFRQIDPLYVLDLSDPADPRTTGELKIPGYSAYLHPVGEGLLLGIGQDATEEGRPLGTQVSLFDVGDPTNPTRLHHVRIPDARSEVEQDHHAFLWWAERNLAMVPVQAWGGQDPFQGAVAYGVDRDGINERARLSHTEHVERSGSEPPDGAEPGFHGPTAPIRRSLVIGDTLFTMSELGIEGADLGSLEERSWLAF